MATGKQVAANQRNATRSTGPRTQAGKNRSRQNALRHGLTADTVITSLEDAEAYRTFEAGIVQSYNPRDTVEGELAVRLASLLWRLRRAVLIETGLFEIQGHRLEEQRRERSAALSCLYDILQNPHGLRDQGSASPPSLQPMGSGTILDTAKAFLRLCHLNRDALKRLGRYETSLWRQAIQIIAMLNVTKGLGSGGTGFMDSEPQNGS